MNKIHAFAENLSPPEHTEPKAPAKGILGGGLAEFPRGETGAGAAVNVALAEINKTRL